ncbi:carnitine O-palmitoyltransferase 2, mitochondrial isoform X2 [Zootermopsis nevadensis]|uniref:carnitine O-palmitoyltransferase 2, mitochondrial isoform X2 n=1 Tax=Zootermopsis nevadensis TaxID=136037 RepID=UPI000B8E2DF7|nr:carnitine O-palmitoyltransferase 2, mitochondrial isoform X2 [Zootermopsis nevadensis]
MRLLSCKILFNQGNLKYVQPSVVVHQKRNRSNKNYDYQYLQRSKVPTLHFQASLPRLPIPELEKTCERYLAAQQPLLSPQEYANTQAIVTEFKKGEGLSLQKKLKGWDSNNKHTSYISELWFDKYLRDRVPLPINYNPQVVFVNEKKPGYGTQLIRATNMLISSLRFFKSIRAGLLEPEVFHLHPKKSDTELFRTVTRLLPPSLSWYGAYLFGAFPLDMSQYGSLFNTTRIPKLDKDRLFQNESAKHMVVMKGGNFYIFDVFDRDGNILPPSDLLACLKYILDDTAPPADYPVGVLTTENRDVWAKARQHLESIGNADIFSLIDSGIFTLCFDDAEIAGDLQFLLRHFLHSDGCNRWFDKSFSMLITRDGYAALNFEHSWGDGVAILRYLQDMLEDSSDNPQIHPDTKPSNCRPETLVKRLDFRLDDKAKAYVSQGKKNFEAFCSSLNISYIEVLNHGRKDCKRFKVSPDSVMQLAFQMAFHKQLGKTVATYESSSTAAFKHGRTETLRPCTMATKTFCEAVNSSNRPSNSELAAMIKKCSEVHVALTKEAAMGQGFDRHLFGLHRFSEQDGGKLPAIFRDPAYTNINRNIISTSTLTSPSVRAGGFGPVVKDGYGVAYVLQHMG